MPHIPEQDKTALSEGSRPINTMGELAFGIAAICNEYIAEAPDDVNFQRIGEVLGAIESAKAEFLTNVHDPYERHKAHVNGNAYEASKFEVERVTHDRS